MGSQGTADSEQPAGSREVAVFGTNGAGEAAASRPHGPTFAYR